MRLYTINYTNTVLWGASVTTRRWIVREREITYGRVMGVFVCYFEKFSLNRMSTIIIYFTVFIRLWLFFSNFFFDDDIRLYFPKHVVSICRIVYQHCLPVWILISYNSITTRSKFDRMHKNTPNNNIIFLFGI